MVLFVDHHAHLLALIDQYGAGAFGIGVFAADELTFDEELSVYRFERADIDVNQLAGELALLVQFFDAVAKDFADLGPIGIGCTRDEGEIGQVAREADAATDDDIGFRAGTAQPLAAGLSEFLQI